MTTTYAVGDLHGRFDLLTKAMSLAEAHCGDGQGTFVCCGDLVDRGPQSRSIIELLMQGPSLPNWRWVVVRGNHEDIMLAGLTGGRLDWWIPNGGDETLRSYGYQHGDPLLPLKVPNNHLLWLAKLPYYHLDSHRAFVHAGFDPSKSLEEQSNQYMSWVRDPRGTDYSYMGRHVVHGHEQYANGPVLTPNKSNLDTFAWLHGRLAVAVFDDAIPGGPIEILWAEGTPA